MYNKIAVVKLYYLLLVYLLLDRLLHNANSVSVVVLYITKYLYKTDNSSNMHRYKL